MKPPRIVIAGGGPAGEERAGARRARIDERRATEEDPAKHKEFLLRTSLIASVRKAQRME